MSTRIRVGIVGHRGLAFADGLKALPQIDLCALCDIDEAGMNRTADKHDIAGRYARFDDLLENVDAVVVSTPMQLHAAQSVRALEAGKHVLSEVTAAVSLEECWRLVDAVRSSGKTYMLSENYCYMRDTVLIREMARKGERESALFQTIPAQMGLANQDGFPHEGKINFVDNEISATTGSIKARGIFDNKDRLMSPGFFARLRIPGSGEYEAMLVRDTAIGSDQGRSFVYVVDADGKATQRSVVTGPLDDGLRIIRQGLKAEDRVVINGLMSIRPGVAVKTEDAEMKLAQTAAAARP